MHDLLIEFFYLIVFGLGVPLCAVAVVGISVSFFQAVTQIQEQSLSYTLKLITAVLSIIVIWPYWSGKFEIFLSNIFLLVAKF